MTVPDAPVAAGAGSKGSSAKESEASNNKRARRRAAAKQNKKAMREADAAQAAKFAERAKEKEQQQEEGKAEQDAGDESTQMDESLDGESKSARVKQEAEAAVKEEDLSAELSNPAYAELAGVLERFATLRDDKRAAAEEEGAGGEDAAEAEPSREERVAEQLREAELGASDSTLSRRKQKELSRLAISELKQLVSKPEVVELHDVNSADPKLLVFLKSYRNSVPVPQHWSQKRKYLQGKRGFEKPPFQLPECIENTGIAAMRGAQQEKDAAATNKQRQRAKMQPKMGKIAIDYQILHDAFFRYQTKPAMTQHGELYYEGRESELRMTEKRPCVYSPALREALGMKDESSPPPWLITMQRIGPPPAYPNLAIPGVSAPIPTGARYGFAEGEWGKPPVDALGRPIFGDVFGVEKKRESEAAHIDTNLWGQLEPEAEEEEEEEEQAMMGEEGMEGVEGVPDGASSTLSSVSGLATPEVLTLRKADGTGTETPDTISRGAQQPPRALYTVLEEKRTSVGGAMFGTAHTYVLPEGALQPSAQPNPAAEHASRIAAAQAKMRAQVDLSLAPEELENLDAATLKRKYEARLSEEMEIGKKQLAADADDEEEEGGKKKKRKKGGAEKDKAYKDIKF